MKKTHSKGGFRKKNFRAPRPNKGFKKAQTASVRAFSNIPITTDTVVKGTATISPFGKKPVQFSQRSKFTATSTENKFPSPSTSNTIRAPRIKGPSPIPHKDPNSFPMRINKYIAWKGFSTRRGADDLINRKAVAINGRIANLGDKVIAEDIVDVRSGRPDQYEYYAYNKPRGITSEPTLKNKSIIQSIPLRGIFPVAGIDINAEGLVILTNDRRIIDRIQNPRPNHIKEYIIHTVQDLRPNFKEKVEAGFLLKNGLTLNSTVLIKNERLCIIHTTDNGNHIREMCSKFFAEIKDMKRTRFLNINLGAVAPNSYRKIEDEELIAFLRMLGL